MLSANLLTLDKAEILSFCKKVKVQYKNTGGDDVEKEEIACYKERVGRSRRSQRYGSMF